MKIRHWSALSLFVLPALAQAEALTGEVHRQPLNIQAIVMFCCLLAEPCISPIGHQNVLAPGKIITRLAGELLAFKMV